MFSMQLNSFGVPFLWQQNSSTHTLTRAHQQLLIDSDFTQTDTKKLNASMCVHVRVCKWYACDTYLTLSVYFAFVFYAGTAKPFE